MSPLPSVVAFESAGKSLVGGTTLTASGSANTKGSWAEITASCGIAASWLLVEVLNVNNIANFMLDIGTGAAAAEVVIVPNLCLSIAENVSSQILIPVEIPAGTRIAGRIQASTGSRTMTVGLTLISGDFSSGAIDTCTNYGAVTATTKGTQVDPGASANTKGAWVELTASSTGRTKWLLVIVDNLVNFNMGNYFNWLIDIGTGAAASEAVLIPDLMVTTNTPADTIYPLVQWIPVDIPAGTRIAARASSTTNDATDRLLGVSLIGVS